jgi:hypothetical protein
MGLRAIVKGGRLVLDEPTVLPEGTVLDLVVDDEGDDLSESDRAALHAAMSEAWAEYKAGLGRSADDVLASLRARRQ